MLVCSVNQEVFAHVPVVHNDDIDALPMSGVGEKKVVEKSISKVLS